MHVSTNSQAISVRIAQNLESTVGPHRFNMWFKRSARLDYLNDDRQLQVSVPNRLVAEWIDRHFRADLQRAAREAVGNDVALNLCVAPDQFEEAQEAAQPRSHPRRDGRRDRASKRRSPARSGRATLRHSLDEFIVGPSNHLAYNAALQLVNDEHSRVNPLFIHGGVGLGKTHLLQGACHEMRHLAPDARVLYTTGEQFTNQFLASMRSGSLDRFRKRIRRLDLLAIDDVHFLAGKEKSQQEFLHSFDEIDLSGARLVMASDNHPKLIREFSAALVSRCVRGLVVEIKPPDTATRIEIVKALAQRRGISLLETVVAVLASRCQGSIREIEGTLAKLHALANLMDQHRDGSGANGKTGHPIGHALLNRLFESQSRYPARPVTFDRILEVVSEQLQVHRARILGAQRVRAVVLARSLVIYLARHLTGMSYPEITTALNRTSHSTVIAADRRIHDQLTDDAPIVLPGEVEGLPLSDLVERLKHTIQRGG